MHKRKPLAGLALGLGLSLGMITSSAFAGGLDGKSNLVCAGIHVVGCTNGLCTEGSPLTFDMPTFIYVDFKRKVVHGTNESGAEVISPINNFEVTDEAIILQGFENHRGWTAGIDRQNGGLTLSSTGAGIGFIIFGNCAKR